MRAAVLTEHGAPLTMKTVPNPELARDGVIIEVEACGICRSDWHAWQGHGEWADDRVPLGQILGHEPAGTVVELGEGVSDLEIGDRVTVPFNLGDGTCHACRNGHGNVCSDGYALGFERDAQGAFAEYLHVPKAEYNVSKIPSSVTFTAAAALGCRFATAYHGLVHRVGVEPGDRVVVVGCGGVGLSAIQVASAMGGVVIGVDIHER
ncbi:MAG: alcohol dehydrogenase catalytic domain-containing protein, partial [Halobacteriaceae archaeon]